MRRRSEEYVVKSSKYAHWIGLYLSFYLNGVLGPFVHGRLQILQTSEVTSAHVITPVRKPGIAEDTQHYTPLHCQFLRIKANEWLTTEFED